MIFTIIVIQFIPANVHQVQPCFLRATWRNTWKARRSGGPGRRPGDAHQGHRWLENSMKNGDFMGLKWTNPYYPWRCEWEHNEHNL